MSQFSNAIYTLHNNPFVLTPLIVNFYKDMRPQPKNILLAYLTFPLLLHVPSQDFLKTAKITSSLHTFNSKKERLFGIQERVSHYKKITNICLQHALNNDYIKLNSDLSVAWNKTFDNQIESLSIAYKASNNVHKIFRDRDLIEIYQLLGIHQL